MNGKLNTTWTREPWFRFALCAAGFATIVLYASCRGGAKQGIDLSQDQVTQCALTEVRLGDGVPVNLLVTVRWRIAKEKSFAEQFAAPEKYAEAVLRPKARQTVNRVGNTFPSVDTVFKQDRQKFVEGVRAALAEGLCEETITVSEVVVADVLFPKKYTDALEQLALNERELAAIRERNAVDIEAAKAAESKAEADGKVEIKNAEVQGRVAEINAKAEDQRRLSAVAKAETEAQIAEKRAKTDAARERLMAEAQADKERQLSKARLEEKKALKDLEVQKQKEMDQLALEKEKGVAQLCATTPSYANFLINRELASKVQIAVLPQGSDASFLGGLIQNSASKSETRASK
jgi:regulator of protease activity HflC (stomatin/prohibitin superfamily)